MHDHACNLRTTARGVPPPIRARLRAGVLGAALLCLGAAPAGDKSTLRLAAATTVAETGLVEELVRDFQSRHPDIRIEVSVLGALATLTEARQGRADLVITHHPPSEKLFGDEGYGLLRTEIMYDEWAILGPPRDPAGVAGAADPGAALRRLAEKRAPFLAAAPQSGTHKKMAELFELAGVKTGWRGFETTDIGAAATLQQAAQFESYTFANMGSYLANRDTVGRDIVPLYRDHPALRNTYSAIVVSRKRVPGARQELAERFLDYLTSDEAQTLIRDYGEKRFGAQLFIPVAHLDEGLRARRAGAELNRKILTINVLVALLAALAAASVVAFRLMQRARHAERERRLSEERFALAVSGTNDGIWDWNLDTGEVYYSPRFKEMLGYRADDPAVAADINTWRNHIHPADRERAPELLENYLHGRDGIFSVEHRLLTETGDMLWVQLRGRAQRDEAEGAAGRPRRMSGSMTDITERKLQETALAHAALHDTLTGLPNRTLLYERLNQALMTARRDNSPLAVVMLDIDNFKDINEGFGHPSGDLILQQVATRLASGRPRSHTVARLGGDTYVLLAPDIAEKDVKQQVREVNKALEPPFELEGHTIAVKASAGIALFPQHGEDAVLLIQRAEVALHRARRENTGYAVYDVDRDQGSQRYFAFDAELKQAVAHDELVLHYQPIMTLRTGYITAVEALLRWRHPKHGLIAPDAFIPRAEHMGLMDIPTLWVLEQALGQCAAWAETGHPLTVAVNISAGSLQDQRLPDRIAALLQKTGVPPNRLEIEITESAIMIDPARAKETLERLRAMKLALVIDDFGTGYASLGYLKELPVDKIKLDKSFVTNMLNDDSDVEIVRAATLLAHKLGLKVIAEGVESDEVLKLLSKLGCDQAQGHYLSPPLAETELVKWLDASGWEDADARGSPAHHPTSQ